MAKSLKNFAKKQAEEESKETTAPTAEETENSETENGSEDSADSEQSEETETTTEKEASEKKTTSANVLQPGQVAIKASDLKKLQADAKAWNENKTQFATLQDWHKSMKEAGAGLSTQDETTKNDKTASTVSDKPWNQKAAEVYGKGKKA